MAPVKSESVIRRLEKELKLFGDVPGQLLTTQLEALSSFMKEFASDDTNINGRPKSERKLLRAFMCDVFAILGKDCFTLCILSIPRTLLKRISSKEVLPAIQTWWLAQPRPRALTAAANAVVQEAEPVVRAIRESKFQGNPSILIVRSFVDFS